MESKKKKNILLLGIILGLAVVFLSYFNLLGELENSAYDYRFYLRGAQEPSTDIFIVGITDQCLQELGRWPWNRDVHAGLLEVLTEANASVVGMDIMFSEPSQLAEMDQALVEATANSVPVVYPTEASPDLSNIPGFFSPLAVNYPIPELMEVSSAGYINVTQDRDSIMRTAIMWMEYNEEPITSFDVKVWAHSQGISHEELSSHLTTQFKPGQNELSLGDFSFPLDSWGRTLINYSGGPHSYPVLPYHLVLEGAYPPSTFEDKIVLVGYYALGLGDYYFTPFAKDAPMFGVEVHANIVNTIHHAGPINSAPLAVNLLLVFALSLGSIFIYQGLRPVLGFVSLIALSGAFYFITQHLFVNNSIYVESTYPLLALTGSFIAALAYNYVVEQKDKQRVTRIFGRYVAPQVVNEILQVGEDNLKLGGTSRRITILFIDIRGFTPLSEKLPPEEVVAILNEYFEIVTTCIFENKGTIDKFMGDAAMALFNTPLEQEDHALWAVKAAKAITDKGAALQKKVHEMSGVTLHFGIGINTGEVIVGNIGSQTRMEYTAIGDAVNLAARLESNATPGQVLVSQEVYQEVDGRLPLKPVGEIQVKGKSEPVMVYELE
ncbi:adenylate cyclase [Desulfitispora alkaliphila]|uniref:CHASE2 domain-containing protein n=1 Tax=Desulfitispora alkaliphila TaxID=622674 RepID=UPI003D197807